VESPRILIIINFFVVYSIDVLGNGGLYDMYDVVRFSYIVRIRHS
jgi:hypothetical protein